MFAAVSEAKYSYTIDTLYIERVPMIILNITGYVAQSKTWRLKNLSQGN